MSGPYGEAVEDVKAVTTGKSVREAKTRLPPGDDGSLLTKIKAEFARLCREGRPSASAEDLARYWHAQAESDNVDAGRGTLTPQDRQAIALRVAQVMQEMDLRRCGEIEIEDWVHYMLLARSGYVAEQVNSLLQAALMKNGSVLHELQRAFELADTSKSGALCIKEIMEVYTRKVWNLGTGRPSHPLHSVSENVQTPEQFAESMLDAMDLDGDERVSYPEFMAYCLGRRKHEVVLHLYDLSKGAAPKVTPWLVGQELEGVWHTGVVVYGKEYYYSKDTVFAEPGDTSFGKPTRILHLGWTMWRQHEMHEFVTSHLKPIFQRDTYDVVCNNCNHFTDRLCMFLLGKHAPEDVLQQPQWLMKSNFVRVLRPALNWYLRDRIVTRETGTELPASEKRLDPGNHPPIGAVVCVHRSDDFGNGIVGQVCRAPTSTVGDGSISDRTIGTSWMLSCSASLTSPEGVWVKYFDLNARAANGRLCGQLRTELVQFRRLSNAGVTRTGGEQTYIASLRAMESPFCPSSRGVNGVSGASRGLASVRAVPLPGPDCSHTSAEESAIETLLSIGVERETAKAALHSSNWSTSEAIRLLNEELEGNVWEL